MARERIFVFGSNLAGRHGAGAALFAHHQRGARYGVGEGRTGHAYAIPTKGWNLEIRSLGDIAGGVSDFIAYAIDHPDLRFEVTRIGCGLAGYRDADIKPMFERAPSNCDLPEGWRS